MFQQIFTVIAPVLIIAAIGYAWERRGLPFDSNMVSHLAANIGAPCLLLSSLLANRPDLFLMSQMVAAAAAAIFAAGAMAYVLLRIMKQPLRVYLPAMMFPNAGNMGIPLCLFAFGDKGLALAVTFFAVMSVLQFSLGQSIAAGELGWKSLLRNPVLGAMILAAVLLQTDTQLPAWMTNTISELAGFVIPLMLLSLGTSLARLKIDAFGRSLTFALFRLIAGLAAGIAISALLGLDGTARGVVIIQSAMPAAVFNYLFAVRYGNRPGEVAGIVVISTVVSFVTLPLLLLFALPA